MAGSFGQHHKYRPAKGPEQAEPGIASLLIRQSRAEIRARRGAGPILTSPGPAKRASGRYSHPLMAHDEDVAQMVATRQALLPTRESLTHKFTIAGHEGYLTIGLYPDGKPGEIFIKISKEGSAISGMCQAFCRAFSIALQFGLTTEEAVARFKGMRFEPMGATSNPDIPEAQSIVDYVARYLEIQFADAPRR